MVLNLCLPSSGHQFDYEKFSNQFGIGCKFSVKSRWWQKSLSPKNGFHGTTACISDFSDKMSQFFAFKHILQYWVCKSVDGVQSYKMSICKTKISAQVEMLKLGQILLQLSIKSKVCWYKSTSLEITTQALTKFRKQIINFNHSCKSKKCSKIQGEETQWIVVIYPLA